MAFASFRPPANRATEQPNIPMQPKRPLRYYAVVIASAILFSIAFDWAASAYKHHPNAEQRMAQARLQGEIAKARRAYSEASQAIKESETAGAQDAAMAVCDQKGQATESLDAVVNHEPADLFATGSDALQESASALNSERWAYARARQALSQSRWERIRDALTPAEQVFIPVRFFDQEGVVDYGQMDSQLHFAHFDENGAIQIGRAKLDEWKKVSRDPECRANLRDEVVEVVRIRSERVGLLQVNRPLGTVMTVTLDQFDALSRIPDASGTLALSQP